MSQATVTQRTNRAARAANIARNGGIVQLAAGGFVTVDVETGSALGHITTVESCDCGDHQFRGVVCKHQRAVRAAEGKECCDCGAYRIHRLYYIGGRGYCGFMCCSANNEHKARPIV